jgi:hypothetical protein
MGDSADRLAQALRDLIYEAVQEAVDRTGPTSPPVGGVLAARLRGEPPRACALHAVPHMRMSSFGCGLRARRLGCAQAEANQVGQAQAATT